MKLRKRRTAYHGRFFVLPWVQQPMYQFFIHPGFWPKRFKHRQVDSKRRYPRARNVPSIFADPQDA